MDKVLHMFLCIVFIIILTGSSIVRGERNCYDILDVKQTDDIDAIREQYGKKIRANMIKKAKQGLSLSDIMQCFQILSSPDKRKLYDESGYDKSSVRTATVNTMSAEELEGASQAKKARNLANHWWIVFFSIIYLKRTT
eukprot:472396_1